MRKKLRPFLHMNNYRLRTKFFLLYIFCVLLPVVLLDAVIMLIISQTEIKEQEKERSYIAESLTYEIESLFQECEIASDSIYTDSELNRFISTSYSSDYEYYKEYLKFQKISGLNYIAKSNLILQIMVYTENTSILNGGYFSNLSSSTDQDWYNYYKQTNQDVILWRPFLSDNERYNIQGDFRIIRRMDYFEIEPESYLSITIDANEIYKEIEKESSGYLIYVFDEKDNLVYTTIKDELSVGDNSFDAFLDNLEQKCKGRFEYTTIKAVDKEWKAYVIDSSYSMWIRLFTSNINILLVLAVLVLVPTLITLSIERPIIKRIELLRGRFDSIQDETEALTPIPGDYGRDEIGSLIRHFNSMLLRITTLIDTLTAKTVEKNKLELLKMRAELNALQSQVNPHFIYNTLESICMRSMIKGETETAQIMRDMSVLLREMSRWSQEMIYLFEEFSFIENYLRLQKYRFGESLDYEISIEESVKHLKIPKLTIISFVENACIYGLEESLTDGFISVIARGRSQGTCITITDNGAGMDKESLDRIREDIALADITRLESTKSTGILNAYLRLRMRFGEAFSLEVDSALEKGTCITIFIDKCMDGGDMYV